MGIDPNPGSGGEADRARPLRADALRNRAALLEAARAVFRRDGLAAQMDDIAAEAGLGVGTLYRNFATKEALVELVVRERLAELLGSARATLEASDAWEGLAALVWRLTTFEVEDRAIADYVVEALQRGAHQQLGNELMEIVQRAVTRAQASGQMRADISALDLYIAVCMIGRSLQFGAPDDGERWRRLVAVLLRGLRATPATPS